MMAATSDPRLGTPDCDCGHSTFRHHGSDRSSRGYLVYSLKSEWTGCKDCTWCDYYKPQKPRGANLLKGTV